jgi:hypothetical protein
VEARVEVSVAAQVVAAGAQVVEAALLEAAGPEPAEAKAGHIKS